MTTDPCANIDDIIAPVVAYILFRSYSSVGCLSYVSTSHWWYVVSCMFLCSCLRTVYTAQWGHVGPEILKGVYLCLSNHHLIKLLGVSQWWTEAALDVLWSAVDCDVFKSIAPMHVVRDDDGVRRLVSSLISVLIYMSLNSSVAFYRSDIAGRLGCL